jgi:hypothetical protein
MFHFIGAGNILMGIQKNNSNMVTSEKASWTGADGQLY